MNAREIIEWVETQIVDVSNEQSVKSFVVELQNKINELDFSLKDGTIPIGYAGSIESTGIYKTIELFTQNSGGKYGFINNVADNILNYKFIDSSNKEHSLWNAIGTVVGEDNVDLIFNGSKATGSRSPECFAGITCLNDFVSEQYFLHNGSGNVTFLFTETAKVDSTAALTEIEVLLRKDSVTSINGIEKSTLVAMDSTSRFNYLKQQYVIDLRNATVFRTSDGDYLLSFKDTRFSDMFDTPISDNCTYFGKYKNVAVDFNGNYVFKNTDEIRTAYTFFDADTPYDILDDFTIGEYIKKTTGVDLISDVEIGVDHDGKVIYADTSKITGKTSSISSDVEYKAIISDIKKYDSYTDEFLQKNLAMDLRI